MKRALVFSSLGYDSGCALRARYLSDALVKNGWDSILVLPRLPNLPFSAESFFSIPYFFVMALRHRVDLAVGIKAYPNCWMALWISQILGARCVVDVDDLDSAWRGGFFGAIASWFQAPAFWLLRHFSTHHRAIRKELETRGKVVTLDQGVDTSIFHPRRLVKERLLIFTAHLNVACQLDLLMDWVGPWLKRHPQWKMVVAGGGPRLREFRTAFESPQVIFTGWLAPQGVAEWIGRGRICISAYSESSGNAFRVPMKVRECLAMGKPMVTNAIEGLSVVGRFLYLCKPGEAAFARTLDRLASDRGDGREMRGAVWVRKNLSWDKVALRFLRDLE